MFRLLGLFAYLLMSISVGMASVAHAMEPPGGVTISATQTVLVTELGHSQGDADEVPADSDQGYPHHHVSCHGDHIAAPFECAAFVSATVSPPELPLGRLDVLASRPADPALRPPQT